GAVPSLLKVTILPPQKVLRQWPPKLRVLVPRCESYRNKRAPPALRARSIVLRRRQRRQCYRDGRTYQRAARTWCLAALRQASRAQRHPSRHARNHVLLQLTYMPPPDRTPPEAGIEPKELVSVQIAGQIELRRGSTLDDHAMKSFSR